MFFSIDGHPIRYGAPEPWKAIAREIGRTKKSRAPGKRNQRSASRYKNDGRPPDTIKTLLRQRLKKKRGTSRQNLHALSVGT